MRRTQLSRIAIFAITGATALSVASCSSSDTSSPTTSPTTVVASPTPASPGPSGPPGPPANGGTRVAGLIASVAGNAIQVTQQNGTATVDFTTSTKVSELTSATLQDITAGSCVGVKPAKDSTGGTVIAEGVRITQAVDGKCQGPKQPPAGEAPPPDGPPGGGGPPAGGPPVQGTVASVVGNTITVNGAGGTPTTVTVTDKTHFGKEAAANTQAIAAGKCIAAEGSQGNGGALEATEITLRPATNGNCSGGGARPHGHHHH